MRIDWGGLTLTWRQKAAGTDLVTQFPTNRGGWWPIIREGFAGAWQRSIVTPVEDALSHPTFWACVTRIASDIAKCRPKLIEENDDGIKTEIENPAYSPVLRRPNHYQNRIQFYTCWMLSKLTRGNAYALKERDNRGVVTALYLLNPTRVQPLVTPSGDVYYSLGQDALSGVTTESLVVPAREIIHDIAYAPYHSLCGLSPIYACGHASMQALTIVGNMTRLFRNGSQIGGVLTAPGQISADTAKRLEEYWETNYAGPENVGKVVALGDGLKFDQPKMMSAVDSQVIDLLRWDDEKVCGVLHVPPYKVSVGPIPSYNNVEALGQEYYGDCLQIHFESLELCLTEGLEINSPKQVAFDIEALNRMDSVQQMDVATKAVIGGIYKPNEGRAKFNLSPVPGGDTVYLQKQNWPLQLLGSDNVPPAPPKPELPPAGPTPVPAKDAAMLLKLIVTRKRQEAEHARVA